jgi:hypothetical protein
VARGDREWPLNEAQRPYSRDERAALGTGYTRVRGIGRAWVSSSPTRIPIRSQSIRIKRITNRLSPSPSTQPAVEAAVCADAASVAATCFLTSSKWNQALSKADCALRLTLLPHGFDRTEARDALKIFNREKQVRSQPTLTRSPTLTRHQEVE